MTPNESLYAEKGRLVTQIEIAQERLSRVNQQIVQIIQEEQKKEMIDLANKKEEKQEK
jgi:hypothetical protein